MKNNKLIACMLLLVVCLFVTFNFTGCSFVDSIIDKISPSSGFSITIGENEYTSDIKGLILDKRTSIGVKSEGLFEVKILANTSVTDYTFSIGEENYMWQDMSDYNFADGFNLKQSNDSFELSYENLATIIYYSIGVEEYVITTPEFSDSVDMFKLVITSGNTGITIGFNICDTDAHTFDGGFTIELDPDQIIF